MNPEAEKHLRLDTHGKPSPAEIAQALKTHLAGYGCGEPLPATKDYAIANRLNRNVLIKAFAVLKAEGVIQINRQRRHELVCPPNN